MASQMKASISFLGSFVEDALGLAERALDAAGERKPHRRRDADVGLDVVLERARDGMAGLLAALRERRAHLDVDGHLVQRAGPGDLDEVMRRQLDLLEDQFLD